MAHQWTPQRNVHDQKSDISSSDSSRALDGKYDLARLGCDPASLLFADRIMVIRVHSLNSHAICQCDEVCKQPMTVSFSKHNAQNLTEPSKAPPIPLHLLLSHVAPTSTFLLLISMPYSETRIHRVMRIRFGMKLDLPGEQLGGGS